MSLWGKLPDEMPGDFHAHVLVALAMPTMRETHPATLARPEVATQIGDFVDVFCAETIEKQFLNPRSKCFNSNLTDVNDNVIVVIVRGSDQKVLDMRIFFGSSAWRARHQVCSTITRNNAFYRPHAVSNC